MGRKGGREGERREVCVCVCAHACLCVRAACVYAFIDELSYAAYRGDHT